MEPGGPGPSSCCTWDQAAVQGILPRRAQHSALTVVFIPYEAVIHQICYYLLLWMQNFRPQRLNFI